MAYYTKMKSLWEDLNNFRPIPDCVNCTSVCSCGLNIIREHRQEDCTTRFLRGLNDQYANVRSQLMLMNPTPDIDAAFSMLTQQERQFNECNESKVFFNRSMQSNNESNRGRGIGRGRHQALGRGQGSRVQCTFCDKTSHTIETCYKKHGLPPHLRQRQISSVNYIAAEAPAEKRLDDLSQCSLTNSQKEVGDSTSYELSSHQKDAILQFLKGQEAPQQPQVTNQVQSTTNNTPLIQGNTVILKYSSNISTFVTVKSHLWVIDTGATDHVTFNLDDFQSYQEISPMIVRMPDGSHTTSSIIGTIRFSNQLYLSNVLFIPNFDFKLISVSKLTSKLKCKMLIDDNLCEIQDQATLKRIGVAKCADGLYTLDKQFFCSAAHKTDFTHTSRHPSLTFTAAVTTDDNSAAYTHIINALWHTRLGHIPQHRPQIMHKTHPFINCNEQINPCNSCHLAKQKRLPFSYSASESLSCFDLLHLDIWGPISTPSIHGHKYFLTIVDDKSR
ncbi:uncharacterized protein LOC107645516 [Arachis ipaensis]|uniref:uncharacterized protein LOC107645516 n=1 Tax=Arachis ipaensis TaxID=130454 RepID=UPI0007AF3E19|nr:uncharacterized protein LOC107645516 [Arachis ipaensis]